MSSITELGKHLFQVFRKNVPTPDEWLKKQGKAKFDPDELSKALVPFYEQAKEVRRRNRLGVISRARVVLVVQHEMRKAGYPAEMTRQILFSMIVLAFVGKI